jgi:hypothetical protein
MTITLPIYDRDGHVIGIRVAEVVRPPLIPIYAARPERRVLHGELVEVASHTRYATDFVAQLPELAGVAA